jgi:hypothetical protein
VHDFKIAKPPSVSIKREVIREEEFSVKCIDSVQDFESSWIKAMWEPISEEELFSLIQSAEVEMAGMIDAPVISRFWQAVKIRPEKWRLPPWGDEGGGFWVVGVVGQVCIYFNDIEEGFNISRYSEFGRIDEYYGSQAELKFCVLSLWQDLMKERLEGGLPNAVEQS